MVQILAIGWVLAALAATIHVLLRYERAASAVAWIFAFWTLPVAGASLYLVFAMYRAPRAVRRRRSRVLAMRGADRGKVVAPCAYPPHLAGSRLARIGDALGAFPLVAGNSVSILPNGDAAFAEMIRSIREATREVCLLTYILEDGRVASALREALLERAAAGVRIRVLYDEFGSLSLSSAYVASLRAGGVEIEGFLKPNPFKRRFQLQHRNHRKLLVVDGAAAFTGGQNWADEYGESTATGRPLRDLFVRVDGPVCPALRRVFVEDWGIATGRAMDGPLPEPLPPRGSLPVRVVPHGPDEEDDRLFTLITTAIHTARSDVLLVTPYFVPSGTMREALRIAAASGLRVRVLVPRRSDNLLADLAARRQFAPLVNAGAEIWLAEGPLLHAKALVIDGSWCTVGSANYDYRSFHCNYELNLEIADAEFARRLVAHFEPDFALAHRLDADLFRRRSFWHRALQNAASLFEAWL